MSKRGSNGMILLLGSSVIRIDDLLNGLINDANQINRFAAKVIDDFRAAYYHILGYVLMKFFEGTLEGALEIWKLPVS